MSKVLQIVFVVLSLVLCMERTNGWGTTYIQPGTYNAQAGDKCTGSGVVCKGERLTCKDSATCEGDNNTCEGNNTTCKGNNLTCNNGATCSVFCTDQGGYLNAECDGKNSLCKMRKKNPCPVTQSGSKECDTVSFKCTNGAHCELNEGCIGVGTSSCDNKTKCYNNSACRGPGSECHDKSTCYGLGSYCHDESTCTCQKSQDNRLSGVFSICHDESTCKCNNSVCVDSAVCPEMGACFITDIICLAQQACIQHLSGTKADKDGMQKVSAECMEQYTTVFKYLVSANAGVTKNLLPTVAMMENAEKVVARARGKAKKMKAVQDAMKELRKKIKRVQIKRVQ